jgi:antitoxin component YwqK of YwqJK toxin-antitoxin module
LKERNLLVKSAIKMVALLVAAAGMLVSAGCSPRTLEFRNVVISNGLIHAGREDSPYSGKVTNMPEHVVFARREAYWPYRDWVKSVLQGSRVGALLEVTPSVCEGTVSDGKLHGELICRRQNAASMKYKMHFRDGALHGKFVTYDLSEANEVIAESTFDNDRLQGVLEVTGPNSRKVVARSVWNTGQMNGVAEYFSDATGHRVGHAEYLNGQLNGEMTSYTQDGKQLLYRVRAVAGAKDGVEEEYYPSGQVKTRVMWKHGKKDGLSESWGPQGELSYAYVYKDGAYLGERPRPAEASTDAAAVLMAGCVGR